MALGLNTNASDENSVAIGNTANASAKNTLAMGTNTKALSEAAMALGTMPNQVDLVLLRLVKRIRLNQLLHLQQEVLL